MSFPDTSIFTPKFLVAGIAVAIALMGIITGLKWLTVAGLLVWVAAMIYFGRGNRHQQ